MLKISTLPQEKEQSFAIPLLAPILLFFSTMGVLYSMLQITRILQQPGLVSPMESFRILLNLLFAVSENLQNYQYTHFIVSIPPENYPQYITVAVAVTAVALAAYIFVMRHFKSKPMAAGLFLFAAGAQIYFGVFALPIWNIVFCTAVAWHLLTRANPITFAGLTAAAVVMAIVLYPGASPALAGLAENIRDQFGTQVERPFDETPIPQEIVQQPDYLSLQPVDAGQNLTYEGGEAFAPDTIERFTGSQIGTAVGQRIWLLWLIGLAFALGFAIWLAAKLVKSYHSRKIFNSADCNLAIDNMFRHAVAWLVEFGIAEPGVAFSSYKLGETLPSYAAALELWQKAVFSGHEMQESDKTQMQDFLQETKNTLRQHAGVLATAKHRIRLIEKFD